MACKKLEWLGIVSLRINERTNGAALIRARTSWSEGQQVKVQARSICFFLRNALRMVQTAGCKICQRRETVGVD